MNIRLSITAGKEIRGNKNNTDEIHTAVESLILKKGK